MHISYCLFLVSCTVCAYRCDPPLFSVSASSPPFFFNFAYSLTITSQYMPVCVISNYVLLTLLFYSSLLILINYFSICDNVRLFINIWRKIYSIIRDHYKSVDYQCCTCSMKDCTHSLNQKFDWIRISVLCDVKKISYTIQQQRFTNKQIFRLLWKINVLTSCFVWLILLDLYPIEKYSKFLLNLTFGWKCMCNARVLFNYPAGTNYRNI